jgi:hypothetical protein
MNRPHFKLTLQNSIPRTEFPDWSNGGDQSAIPSTFGITTRRPPHTPDFAGRPTFKKMKKKKKTMKKLLGIKIIVQVIIEPYGECKLPRVVVHSTRVL